MPRANASTISIDVDGHAMPCFLARPAGQETRPAVIVLQEIFGVNAEIRRIAELVAQAGYVAFAPNFFHRTHPDLDAPYTPEGMAEGAAAATAVTTANLLRDLAATIHWLKSQPFVRGDRVGAWGFCMGSSVAFLASTLPDIACAICFYGAQIARPWRSGEAGALSRVDDVRAPLLLVFGGRDKSIPPEAIAAIDEALTKAGKRHQIRIYPEADHAFFRKGGSERDRADVADAWERVRLMLATELG